jgi:plasmid stabilization system protein ParE
MSFRLTARAEADLDEIDDYVASEFGEAVAERVIDRLFETFELLADNPGAPSVIIYRSRDELEVLRVWHGRRDPTRIGSETEED